MHPYLLFNGEIRKTSEPLVSPGQTGYMTGWGVFSTLRVSDGVLFAFERHYERMQADALRIRVPFPFSLVELRRQLHQLLEANSATDATLRVCVVRNRGGAFQGTGTERDADLVAFTTDLKNWGGGVRLTYVPHGRHGLSPFAGVKINSWAQNLAWLEDANQRGFDEVILLNELGEVSECTSANIFVVQENYVLTPPLSTSGCLPGVTRAVLLEEISIPGLRICEAEITPAGIESARQVFITSTTRDLLAVREVDGRSLAQHPETLVRLQDALVQYRARYVREHADQYQTIDA
ncbi:MAG TPA: aminotransferase class IV [Bryobacteraceae bacterium]|jgi:branched-chain amino acid aminotransferase|nr:aminotransferase class IV [Bryobacteraceae bacterium]